VIAVVALISLLAIACMGTLFRPWLGVVAFYFFTFLIPEWNWRWAMPSYFPYPTIITCALLAGIAINGFQGFAIQPKLLSPITGLLLFICIAFLSSWSSIGPMLSSFYLRFLWKIVFMACMTMVLIDTPQKMLSLLFGICIAQAYNSFQINLQYFQDGFSAYVLDSWAFGAKGDNNIYSSFTIPMLAGSLALGLCSDRLWIRATFLTVSALEVHQMMLLQSRGAMLGSLLTLTLVAVFVRKNSFTLSMITGGVLLGLALAGPPVVREFLSIFEGEENRDASAASRLVVWKAGLAIMRDNPLLGVGPWAGSLLVPTYAGLNVPIKELHNLFLEIGTGCGVFATAAYFGSYWLSWFGVYRRRHSWSSKLSEPSNNNAIEIVGITVISAIPGYFLASMFSAAALAESSYVILALGAALSNYLRQQCFTEEACELNTNREHCKADGLGSKLGVL
jgi:O-antigen ligase